MRRRKFIFILTIFLPLGHALHSSEQSWFGKCKESCYAAIFYPMRPLVTTVAQLSGIYAQLAGAYAMTRAAQNVVTDPTVTTANEYYQIDQDFLATTICTLFAVGCAWKFCGLWDKYSRWREHDRFWVRQARISLEWISEAKTIADLAQALSRIYQPCGTFSDHDKSTLMALARKKAQEQIPIIINRFMQQFRQRNQEHYGSCGHYIAVPLIAEDGTRKQPLISSYFDSNHDNEALFQRFGLSYRKIMCTLRDQCEPLICQKLTDVFINEFYYPLNKTLESFQALYDCIPDHDAALLCIEHTDGYDEVHRFFQQAPTEYWRLKELHKTIAFLKKLSFNAAATHLENLCSRFAADVLAYKNRVGDVKKNICSSAGRAGIPIRPIRIQI